MALADATTCTDKVTPGESVKSVAFTFNQPTAKRGSERQGESGKGKERGNRERSEGEGQ